MYSFFSGPFFGASGEHNTLYSFSFSSHPFILSLSSFVDVDVFSVSIYMARAGRVGRRALR